MTIKRLMIFLGLLVGCFPVHSQSFEWVLSNNVNYSLNPTYPECPVTFDNRNQRIINSRIDSVALIYGSTSLGVSFIEGRDTNGVVIWQERIGDKAAIQRIVTDTLGNSYIAGLFQQTLFLSNNDSLPFITGTFINLNTFIIKLDISGNLIWKRNLTADWPGYEGVEALAMDPSGNCWYAMTDYFIAKVVKLSFGGNDVEVRTIHNGKLIGNISFDPWGGMFVSGAAQNGNFIMNTDTFVATDFYNMFIARFNPIGEASWAFFGHDITFQRPVVIADGFGNAFMAGNRYDTTSFNGLFFTSPYLTSDFFAFKIDTAGNVGWGLQQPPLGIGPYGSFEPGSNLMVSADGLGNFYLGGLQRGTVDWGNGYFSSTSGFPDRKIAITCIDPSGNVQWVKLGGSNSSNYMHALDVSQEGACYFTGSFGDNAIFDTITINTSNFYNFVIGKINQWNLTGIAGVEDAGMSVYPNPCHGFLYFADNVAGSSIEIFDNTGRLAYAIDDSVTNYLDIQELSQGIYFIVITKGNKIMRSKIIRIE